jgi:8-oxo-dGTP diphosphatase
MPFVAGLDAGRSGQPSRFKDNNSMPPRSPRFVRAAGGVVYRDGGSGTGPQFLLVHRNRYHDWSLPKGKLDRNESYEEAATREVLEETGVESKLGTYLGAVTYPTQRGRPKLVKYWLLEAQRGQFTPNLEVDKAEWVGINGARALLTYNRDVRVIDRAAATLANSTSTRIYVVRHSNAGVRSKWKGPDKKRPLTAKGHNQALDIADLLSRHPVTEVLSSPARRCFETVEPIATKLGLEVVKCKQLKETMDIDQIREYLSGVGPGAIVMGTHKDWVGPLIRDLDDRGVPVRGARRWPKSSIWVFDLVDGKIEAGYYAGRGTTAIT